jgi:hypothetical protein
VREQLLQSLPEVREQLLQSLHEQLSNFLCFTQEERVYNYEDPTARKTMQVIDTCFRMLFQLYSLSLSVLVDPDPVGSVTFCISRIPNRNSLHSSGSVIWFSSLKNPW